MFSILPGIKSGPAALIIIIIIIIIRIFIHTRSTQILITTVYTQLDNTDAKIIK